VSNGAAGVVVGIGAVIAGIVGIVAMQAAVALWEAFVLLRLWAWFVVPTFGVPTLTYPIAVGIAATVSLLTLRTVRYKGHEVDLVAAWSSAFVIPALILAIGWTARLFI
jgi:hypothetical protein